MTVDEGPAVYARVAIESALPHLDRPFDYLVPEKLQATVTVGSRVRVPFAGQLLSAVVVEMPEETVPGVRLQSVSSAAKAPSYTPQAIALAREVAERYGGALWDVLRLMAPPRVAAVETRTFEPAEEHATREAAQRALEALAHADPGEAPRRLVWAATPSPDHSSIPADAWLALACRSLAADPAASVLLVVPDARAASLLAAAAARAGLTRWSSRHHGQFVVLDHDDGPSPRYAAYLAAMRGTVRLVIGTRPAVLQPVPRLGFVGVWDEGSDALQEAHAPYLHARTVAAMRSQTEDARLVLGAFAPSVDAAALVAHGFAEAMIPTPATRDRLPAIEVLGEERRRAEGGSGRHWMPSQAWRGLAEESRTRPVAILVPRAGYVNAVACAQCGTWQECPDCGGELAIPSHAAAPRCRDCDREMQDWHCAECHSPRLAAARQGVSAISEQVRRMAPGAEVHVSSAADGTAEDFSISSGIVVATPGALPAVEGGYARLVIVAAHAPLAGGLGAELLAMRWWLNAAALVASRGEGGKALLVGDIPTPLRQRLVSWSPWELAVEAYRERVELRLPPARRAIALEGDQRACDAVRRLAIAGQPLASVKDVTVSETAYGLVVLVSRAKAAAVISALRSLIKERSRAGDTALRMRVDAPL